MRSPLEGLVCIGQALGVARARDCGPLANGAGLELGVVGAELNVAIGVRRLGLASTWVGHVGADPVGALVARELRAEGVRTVLTVDPERPTAFMVTERRTADRRRVVYYRVDAAGAGLGPRDLLALDWSEARMLHVTGITACLGTGPAELLQTATETARRAGLPVSLDLNHRLALADADQFRTAVTPLIARSDIVFATQDEATVITGAGSPDGQARRIHAMGPQEVVIKLGAEGSLLAVDDHVDRRASAARTVIDPVGAGDAFAAGYLAARLDGRTAIESHAQAVAVAAVCLATDGDWDGLPTAAELAEFASLIDIAR